MNLSWVTDYHTALYMFDCPAIIRFRPAPMNSSHTRLGTPQMVQNFPHMRFGWYRLAPKPGWDPLGWSRMATKNTQME